MISLIFGLPGSGKTTILAALAADAQRGKSLHCGNRSLQSVDHYKYIYSNTPIMGCYQLDLELIGRYSFRDSLILIDESVMIADSRDYKNLDKALMMFMKQHRKYNTDIIMVSQGYRDNDVRIRDLAANVYFVERVGFGCSRMSAVSKVWAFKSKNIEEQYELGGIFSRRRFRRKKYYHLFDTLYIHGKPLPDLDCPRAWSVISEKPRNFSQKGIDKLRKMWYNIGIIKGAARSGK